MKITIVALLTSISVVLLSADELKIQGDQHGKGKHIVRSVNDIEKDIAGLVISEFSKDAYVYRVTTAANFGLVISRNLIQKPEKSEDLFEFNNNFGVPSPAPGQATWIVDVFAEEHQISFLMSVSTGYLYIKIVDDLNQFKKDSLILPAEGVGKGKWNVIQCSSQPTTFGVIFPAFSHGDKIKKIKLNSHHVVQVQFVGEAAVSLFDLSGDFIKKDDVNLESEKLHNPSVVNIAEFFGGMPANMSPEENLFLMKWVNGRQGGKKQVIEEIRRFSDDPRSLRALSVIEDAFASD